MKIFNEFYSNIPVEFLRGKRILEVGSAYGKHQMLSIHSDLFQVASDRGNYVGYDKQVQKKPLLNIIEADIRTVDLQGEFDIILVMHCLEHIPINDWNLIFDKLKRVLRVGGWLIVAGPYMEPSRENPIQRRDPSHVVFDIDEDFLERYLPDVQMFRASIKYPMVFGVRNLVWWFRCLFNSKRWMPFKFLVTISFIAFWRKDK